MWKVIEKPGNVIYLELLYMGYEIQVYNNNGKEIDFLLMKNLDDF